MRPTWIGVTVETFVFRRTTEDYPDIFDELVNVDDPAREGKEFGEYVANGLFPGVMTSRQRRGAIPDESAERMSVDS